MERESEIELDEQLLNSIPKLEKGRVVEIYSRSITEDRLKVPLPPELHGEWVLNNELEINRKKALGFVIDTKYAMGHALHHDGATPTIGDVIHMITRQENMDILKQVAKDRYFEAHATRKQKEEKDFVENNKNTPIVPVTDVKGQPLSKVEGVTGREIIESLPQS
jgi:hypothetical protein